MQLHQAQGKQLCLTEVVCHAQTLIRSRLWATPPLVDPPKLLGAHHRRGTCCRQAAMRRPTCRYRSGQRLTRHVQRLTIPLQPCSFLLMGTLLVSWFVRRMHHQLCRRCLTSQRYLLVRVSTLCQGAVHTSWLRPAVLVQRASVLNTLNQPTFNNSLKSSLASQGERCTLHLKEETVCYSPPTASRPDQTWELRLKVISYET